MLLDRFDLVEEGDYLLFEAENSRYKITIKKNFKTILEKYFQDCLEAIEFYKETKKNETLHFYKKIELFNS